ncbi:tetratricopeptide repeat protein [Tenacibaculum skagerrakense]|uniref:Tetratricopeptide repeat protein n=1 Tax=Tenacibaculum skagerrakense TaxID=186571 RepID=A0A4R2NS65_9FLAO|nr:CHAT domain-containing protein [Tenacibaculum skagerrakense]TCP24205.1 tetratricopeptide repeat protein [Tenacibaculum skagerrakense]
MFRKGIIFFLILYISINCYGQNSFNYNLKTTSDKKINEKDADSILNTLNSDTNKKIIKAFNYSRIFYKKGNLKLAIKYAKIQNNLSQKGEIYPKHYHTSFYLIGKYFMVNNKLDSAIIYSKRALELNHYPKKIAQSFCQIATCYRKQGDLHKSIEYYTEGIPLLIKHAKPNSILFHIISLTDACNQVKTKRSARIGLHFLEKCDSLINKNKYLTPEIGSIDICKGVLYAFPSNYDYKKASNYYRKALKFSLNRNQEKITSLAYLNLGELYLDEGKDSSLYFLNKGLKHIAKSKDNFLKDIESDIYRNISKCYIKKDNLELALKNINIAIKKSFQIPFNKKEIELNDIHFEKASSRRNIVLAFKDKLNILNHLYNKTQKKEYLEESIKTVYLCDAFINYTIQNSTEINTKFLWRDDVSEIYNFGVLAAFHLGDNELTNSIIEKNKAFLLTQSIKENNSQLNLPYQVKSQLKKYQEDIYSLEEKSDENKKIKDSLFNIKLSFDRFKDSITKVYPEYFSDRNNIQPISLEKIKEKLNDNSIILSYHLDSNNNNLFGLFTSKIDSYTFKAKIDSSFYELVSNYKKLISKPLTHKSEFKNFYSTSNKLFNNLFPDNESRKFIKNKNLIIISNDILQNIPFESLYTNNENPKYLIEDHNISYAYSASFLDFNNSIKRETSKNLAAFAPVSFSNSELKLLQATEAEVKTIDNEISGDLFTNTNATKTNFLNNSSDYKILHLATHASSSHNPAIYFSKDTLHLHELYTHKTNADLVVLSACESNLGELKKGEGVFSLSRGFFYSGAKSVISSLWNVNDVSTSSIMKDFYKNLNNNQSKSEALNNAKRNYLKEHSLSEKSPYYWASFVLIGDTSPTYPATPYWIYLLGVVALFSFTLFFYNRN